MRLFLAAVVALALGSGIAHAGSDPAAVPSTPPGASAPAPGDVPLALSIRALSISQPPFADTGDVDRVKGTNGAGTNRWPSANTPIARGVYFSFSPSCIPGVDEPYFPGAPRPSARRR